MPSRRYLLILTALFGAWWTALAIRPWDRQAWLLQNLGVVAAVTALAASRRRMSFSRVSYTLIFLFLCLLEVGAHYTYSLGPVHRASGGSASFSESKSTRAVASSSGTS